MRREFVPEDQEDGNLVSLHGFYMTLASQYDRFLSPQR